MRRWGNFLFVHPDPAGAVVDEIGPALPIIPDQDCVRRTARLIDRDGATGTMADGFTIDREGDWVLWRRCIVRGDKIALAAGLYHPHRLSWDAAPDRLCAAFTMILA